MEVYLGLMFSLVKQTHLCVCVCEADQIKLR